MIKIDLITGFLGSGKTTFLKRYARYLMDGGQRVGILENDHGAVNVDMLLLRDLEGERCITEMVAGACDADCHRRRFKTKLIALAMSGCDRVLVEPSGVFDVDEFFDVLYEEPLDRFYEIGSVIAVVDADLGTLSDSGDYLLASQAACAGAVVLSKTQEATAQEIEATILHIEQALERVGCHRDLRGAVWQKDWDSLTDADFAAIADCGYVSESFVKRGTTDDSGFRTLYFFHTDADAAQLRRTVGAVFDSGGVFRVKGFVRDGEGWLELNATRDSVDIRPSACGQDVMIVIGEAPDEKKIREIFRKGNIRP